MIGWLSGRVTHQLRNGALLVDVQGVGYEVHVASADPPPFDELVELFIFTVVREDAIQLFGFHSIEDREFFELLLVTPGVGPSTAIAGPGWRRAILSSMALVSPNAATKGRFQVIAHPRRAWRSHRAPCPRRRKLRGFPGRGGFCRAVFAIGVRTPARRACAGTRSALPARAQWH